MYKSCPSIWTSGIQKNENKKKKVPEKKDHQWEFFTNKFFMCIIQDK